ncbi:site-specific integrase [Aliiroseovarius sp. Z3]|uniref:tyrosine-type recombinase/integrase n=1 Tax=Aliiroseovarius sp. Z3 TaxID=2811402 RepID=UPI0023B2DD4D|nr:site-specific integrase [Aliiroseovarius sp. Z3]MDE9449979.1 site-specific integrase [Aliiroseovarius sp. Z3]
MKKELTDRFLRSLKPPATGRVEISDTRRPGLRFRLSETGRAVWMYEKRIKGGLKRKHTLGTWPEPIGLSEARAMALELEAEAAKGIDRIEIAEAQRIKEETATAEAISIADAISAYDDLHLNNLRTGSERKRQLESALRDHLNLPVASLRRSMAQTAIDAKAREGRLVYANRIRAALKAFTHWCWKRGYLAEDIGASLSKAVRETARERVLSVGEIREIWTASFEMGDLWGPFFRLLLLTAQRRGEILNLKQSEIDFDRSRIVKPGSLTKNGKAHITHLSEPALLEVRLRVECTQDEQETDLLFTTTGKTPVSGVSKAKARLDKLLGEDFEPWRIHDIRTAFATAMADAGVAEAIADRVLNHSASGSAPSAVARVYNQSELLPQRAAALDRWSDIVSGKASLVVRMA